MTPLEMIAEWRKGCSCSMEYAEDGSYLGQHLHPEKCEQCTRELIDAVERRLKMTWFERLQQWFRLDSLIIARRHGRQRVVQPAPAEGSIPREAIRVAVKDLASSRARLFEIWIEGYRISGNSSTANLLGTIEADTFREAVLSWYRHHPSVTFDPGTLTNWGLRHFDNEADARKSFG